ncbi:MAG TPA: VIT domain-containing protein [Longimicrobium sp.]|nr:VIT domain-containing protein [Longimicrobium sp.]
MLTRPLLLLPIFLACAAPLAAQGIIVPVRCAGECAPRALSVDSVDVWSNLEHGTAATYVDHVFRNGTGSVIDGAFFFPLPADAVLTRVALREGDELELYNEWSGPDESRWILEGIVRERRDARLGAYAGMNVVHVRVPSIPAHGVQHLQIAYTQPLRAEDGVIAWRYPLTAGAAPAGHLTLGMTIKTEAGFRAIASTSHTVDVQWGMEPGPCRPQERCGTRGYPSERVRVVRLLPALRAWAQDFELVYTPKDSTGRSVSVP